MGTDLLATDEPSAPPSEVGGDLTTNIAAMVGSLLATDTVDGTLAEVVGLAVTTIEGCDFAGICMLEGNRLETPVFTDPIVADLDGLQRETGEGPCLDALTHGLTFYASDLGEDVRWPLLGPRAVDRGIRSVLGLPLPVNGQPGALNLYARYHDAFGVIDRGRGALLAAMAGLAITVAQTHEDEERRAHNLQEALSTREVIGQAQGILMERDRISSEQAFDILRRASQHLNRKLREVAQGLVDTGERPDTGSHR